MRTPEGIYHTGTIEPATWAALRELNGGEDYSMDFWYAPDRKFRPKVYDIARTEDRPKIHRRDMKKAGAALSRLSEVMSPYDGNTQFSVQRSRVPILERQRSSGALHAELPWGAITSDNSAMGTEFLVDHSPIDRSKGTRVITPDILATDYEGVTFELLDEIGQDGIADLGMELWTPDANEVVVSRLAAHRSVPNNTGSEQDRVFARALSY